MNIEIEREADGRWIAEVPELPGALVYGASEAEARSKATVLILRVIADRIEAGEPVPFDPDAFFDEAESGVETVVFTQGPSRSQDAALGGILGAASRDESYERWSAAPARRAVRALLRIGWAIKRRRGSHRTLSRPGWPDYVFAYHDGREIGPQMLARIAARTGLQPDDL